MFKSQVLSRKKFDALNEKAGNYDKIVAAIVVGNPDLKAEDITYETIEELMQSDSDSETDTELQSKFDALQSEYNALKSENSTLKTQNEELQQQVDNLLGSAGEDPAPITSSSEPSGKKQTLVDYANKNKGDTAAIINEAVKDGFLS